MKKSRPIAVWWTVAVFSLMGLLCGLACAGVFTWWWSAQPKSYVVYGGSYEPLDGVPFARPDSPLINLGEADPWPELFIALISASTVVGFLVGCIAVGVSRFRRSSE